MTVESSEDRLELLEDFGVGAVYNGTSIIGIFDSEPFIVSDGTQTFSTDTLTFLTRTADVAGITIKGSITIEGIEYQVRDRKNDGTGFTELELYFV